MNQRIGSPERSAVLADIASRLGHATTGAEAPPPSPAPPVERLANDFSYHRLHDALSERVLAQPSAVERIARSLVPSLNGLKFNAHRPNGVLFFNGPTGVGKTQAALAIAEVVYGSSGRVIRIDGSECDASVSTSRLIGPPPGYVGYDRSDGWLTSLVIDQPESVVLIDEIEKADPAVWNLLLQVNDAGRLTDARGRTADFSNSIIVMTANVGAAEASRVRPGFIDSSNDRQGEMTQAVTRTFTPEFLARIDAVIHFDGLDREALVRIGRQTFDRFAAAVVDRGWHISVDDAVIEHVAHQAADPRHGARTIERSLERELLAGLVEHRPGRYHAALVADRIEWS